MRGPTSACYARARSRRLIRVLGALMRRDSSTRCQWSCRRGWRSETPSSCPVFSAVRASRRRARPDPRSDPRRLRGIRGNAADPCHRTLNVQPAGCVLETGTTKLRNRHGSRRVARGDSPPLPARYHSSPTTMNSMPLGTSLAALVAVLGGCATAAPSRCTTVPATHRVLSESACESPVPSGPEFTCGTLQLPEDAEQAESCMVEVAWARYEPASPRRAPPIFLLGGGPGGSILGDAQRAFDFARRAAPDRPWIIHDPRGAGRSQPRLDCAGFPNPASVVQGGARNGRQRGPKVLASGLSCAGSGRLASPTPRGDGVARRFPGGRPGLPRSRP